jgi:ATP-dependent helicase/nuclease subunit A
VIVEAIEEGACSQAHKSRSGALRSQRQQTQTPVLLPRDDDGSLVEGTVDFAFYEDTSDFVGWTAVDFKTDREVEAMSLYIVQMKVYSEAVSLPTGSPARGIILVL